MRSSAARFWSAAALAAGLAVSGIQCRRVESPPWLKSNGTVEAAQVGVRLFPYFSKWLDRNGHDPLAYLVEKCKAHQVVVIGEHHTIKNYLELVRQAVPRVYAEAGVRVLGLEVCNADDNDKLARLVNGERYDRDLAYEIARSEDWELWGYKEYWDILEAVWQLNRSLIPAGREPMRVVGIDKRLDFQLDALWRANQLKDPALVEKAKNQPDIYKRDDWMTANVESGILATGAKGIVLVGFNHSFVHYAQPKLKDGKLESEWPRMTNVLHQKYGDKIFQVGLHGPYASPSVIDKNYKGADPVLPDLLERIMAAHGNAAVGFDVEGSPFAGIRDGLAYYFHWQPRVRFADLCEGFIFLKPVKALSPCSWMDNFISDAMFKKSKAYYEWAYKKTFKDSAEVNAFFKAGLGSL